MHSNYNDLKYSLVGGKVEDYLTFKQGNTNIILSAPHGGGMKPRSIPLREYGVKLRDTYTRRLIEALIEEFRWENPYYIYADIHRSRVDLNRDIKEGAQGNETASKIWLGWEALMNLYLVRAKSYNGKCLYIDLHSHNDSWMFELGYNLSANNYRNLWVNRKVNAETTLDSLEQDKYDMIFGKKSFKETLEKFKNYHMFYPQGGEKYFNGGRNVEVFSGGGTGAIQIEIPVHYLKEELKLIARSLYVSILEFRDEYVK